MTIYSLTWDQSHWDEADAEWSQPGTYALSSTFSLATTESLGSVDSNITANQAMQSLIEIATSFTLGAGTENNYVTPDGSTVYVSPTTARLYMRLPDMYRDADAVVGTELVTLAQSVAVQNVDTYDDSDSYNSGASFDAGSSTAITEQVPTPDRPLLRYLSCLVDQAGKVESMLDRFNSPTASALTDPKEADTNWLPWLGQLVAVPLSLPLANETTARTEIANALVGSFRKGSVQSIAQAVAATLTGTQSVQIINHYGGNAWLIGVNTLTSETPTTPSSGEAFIWGTSTWDVSTIWAELDPITLLVQGLNVKPVGMQIIHTTSSSLVVGEATYSDSYSDTY